MKFKFDVNKFILVFVLSLPVALSSHAGSIAGTGGATEVTQILNNIQLLQSVYHQAEMVKAQLKNMEGFGNMEWGRAQDSLASLTKVVSQGQSLSYALGNAEAVFKQKYPGYTAHGGGDFAKQYEDWSQTTLSSIRGALSSAGLQSEQFASEEEAMRSIRSMSARSSSTVQAVQAGVMVAAQQVEQLQKLRQLQMAQIQAQGAFLAKEQGQQDKEKEISDKHFRRYVKKGEEFASKGGKR
jgi:P-type conjugative transfer protein TrbJ